MIKDGGPAFPHQVIYGGKLEGGGYEEAVQKEQGMSLRDWFAGKALAGYRAQAPTSFNSTQIAILSYADADAMLEERNKEESND